MHLSVTKCYLSEYLARDLLSVLALLPAARLLRAQQSQHHLSADVKVVNLLSTVRDKQGQIVREPHQGGLHPGRGRPPANHQLLLTETDLPLTLGLLVDTSGSERREIPDERRASIRFFEQVLRPDKDQAFVIHFDFEVELLEDLTNSREKLEKALNQLDTPQLQRQQGGGIPAGRGRGGGTTLYDAVLLAGDELMKKQRGRKALVLLSDGVDTGSKRR